jgi:prepilin-type N-terminal cleavage/methylation domain-containing protein/prepilin-type processing-associated H-X9-DG protein
MTHTLTRRKGFTLIELLVVIAIIAILAAILFPVFGRARDSARRASGISNVKQIMLGIHQYLQDYDSRYFQTVTERQGTDTTRFPGSLAATSATDAALYSYRQKLQPYVKSDQLFKDPSAPQWPASSAGQFYSVDYGIHLNESKFTAGFGQQAWYAANPSFGINEDVIESSIANASKFIIVGEAARSDGTPSRGGLFPLNDTTDPTKYYDGFTGGPAAGTLTSQARPYLRHFNGSIFGYADGHVKWTQIGKTWATPVASPGNVNNQWSRDVQ